MIQHDDDCLQMKWFLLTITLLAIGLFHPAFAEEAFPTQPGEAWMEASDYASRTPAVGIAVYGRAEDMTTEQVARLIQKVLQKNNINSQYYLADTDRLGVKVGLYMKDRSYGPDDLDGTIQNLQKVRRNFPLEWPNY